MNKNNIFVSIMRITYVSGTNFRNILWAYNKCTADARVKQEKLHGYRPLEKQRIVRYRTRII
jgi:hypothetical protein